MPRRVRFADQSLQFVGGAQQGHLQHLLARTRERIPQTIEHHGDWHEIGGLQFERMHGILLTRRREHDGGGTFGRRERLHKGEAGHVGKCRAHQCDVRNWNERGTRRKGIGVIPKHRCIERGRQMGQLFGQ